MRATGADDHRRGGEPVGASLLAMISKAPPIPCQCALSLRFFASKLAPTRGRRSIWAAGFRDAPLLLPGFELFVHGAFATEQLEVLHAGR